jgi:hypothetical protein
MVVKLRTIGGCEFDYVCEIDVVRDATGRIQEFMPQSRYAKADQTPLNRYGTGPFVKFKIPRALRTSGVYVLTVGDDLKYVGEAADLSARYNAGYGNISPKNCYKGGQETNCRLNSLIHQSVSVGSPVRLWFHQTPEYKALEADMRRQLRPEWNRI